MAEKAKDLTPLEIDDELLQSKLYEIRGCKVMLDADLAEIYGYETKAFNQQVKRNIERFDEDMMFQLFDYELEYLRSQFVTANINSMARTNPFIVLDYGTKDERVFLCGASSKDAGSRITTIVEDFGIQKYDAIIKKLLTNAALVLP